MSDRIRILPPLLINQIAAGEVIERPASILKELLENSIDAKSSMVRVYIEQGGMSLIKVIDNGIGIHPDDISLALTQHATSKLANTEDLFAINSLGFRGEALASIAAVAKVNILSQHYAPTGTTVEVKDVFYNLPARKKFLRSSSTEYNYLQEVLKRIALSKFNMGFMWYHNNKLIKNLAPISGDIAENLSIKSERLVKLLGNKFIDNAKFFDSANNKMRLCGWISDKTAIASSNIQYFYVNDRMVKDRLLNMAVKQAIDYTNINYCVYLYLDPVNLDVNVHPAKQEVRFSEPKLIYNFVQQSIISALQQTRGSYDKFIDPAVFEESSNYNVLVPDPMGNSNIINNLTSDPNFSADPADLHSKLIKNQWRQALLDTFAIPSHQEDVITDQKSCRFISDDTMTDNGATVPFLESRGLSAVNSAFSQNDVNNELESTDKIYAILDNNYLIIDGLFAGDKIIIISVITAIKWLLYNKLIKLKEEESYNLLIPERVKSKFLSSINLEDLKIIMKLLTDLNFALNQIHDNTLLINMIPASLMLFDVKIDYLSLIETIVQAKLYKVDPLLAKQQIVTLLINHLTVPDLRFYHKKDFIKLLTELQIARFNFCKLSKNNLDDFLSKNKT